MEQQFENGAPGQWEYICLSSRSVAEFDKVTTSPMISVCGWLCTIYKKMFCMYVCFCMCMYVRFLYLCIHACVCVCVHVCVHVCVRACMFSDSCVVLDLLSFEIILL